MTTILRCAGVLCKDLYVGNTQNFSQPQLKVMKLKIHMWKGVRMFPKTLSNLVPSFSPHWTPWHPLTWHMRLQKLGIKPCLTALVPSAHGNDQLYLQENILQIFCSPATTNVSSGDKAGRKHRTFLIQIFFKQVRQHNGECTLEILQYFYTKGFFKWTSNFKYF